MTISEAVSLVLQAFAIGRDGDILVLDMGEPVRITDLAETLVRLSGKSHAEFKFIGLRPGEKLFEELFYCDERVFPSACEKIACAEGAKLAWPALKRSLDELYVAMSLGKRELILAQLKRIVPQFTYAGCDQAGNAGEILSQPSVSDRQPPEAPVLVDMPALTYPPWRAKPQATPGLGPRPVGGPGD
jgi:FlaA1/EpsC-like NDP-sugar epimerase